MKSSYNYDQNQSPLKSSSATEGGQNLEILQQFNQIKHEYAEKQQYLQELKILVTNCENVPGVIDQSSRSKIRIHIESLLIDLNEEVFAISEEMAKMF